jgi:hypothetical protein
VQRDGVQRRLLDRRHAGRLMGKGSTRRPEDRKAIEANWPFKQHEQREQTGTPPIANTDEEEASKLPKE